MSHGLLDLISVAFVALIFISTVSGHSDTISKTHADPHISMIVDDFGSVQDSRKEVESEPNRLLILQRPTG